MSWSLGSTLVWWAFLVLSASAQSSNVTQCIANYSWAINSKGQTPCLVAAYLESLCGVPTSVNAIPQGTHYLGPTDIVDDPCKCSSVTYSMVSACGGCQGRTFVNWTTWSEFCTEAPFMQFPLPIDTTVIGVPAWAYMNVTETNGSFDPLLAAQNATNTPATSTFSFPPTPTVSQTIQTPNLTSTSTTPALGATQSSTKSGPNAGAIAGGVVGGLVFLVVIGLGVVWWMVRKRNNATVKDVSFDNRALVAENTGISQIGSTPSPAPFSTMTHSPNDSSDRNMNMYLGSPVTSAAYTTVPASRRSLESVSPSFIALGSTYNQNVNSGRGFTGAAEV